MTDRTRRPRGAPARHRTRRWPPPIAALALAAGALACTTPPHAGCAAGAPPPGIPSASPWAAGLCHQASQKPPTSLNGVVYRDGLLWMASLLGGELVVADPATGGIVGRFGPDQGVTGSPDDLAMAPDGTVYWGGYVSGDVGALTTDGRSRRLAAIGPGVNPLVLGPDGALYVSRLFIGKGLYRIDPATAAVTVLNPDVGTNAFGFGPDGAIFGPTGLTLPSHLQRIDPAGWRATTVNRDVGLLASSVRFPPAARGEAPTTAYVLTATPPVVVQRIDVTTGRRAAPDIRLPLTLADNIAFAPDGRMFVTGFTQPAVAVVEVDGRARTVAIGRR
jgi:sugar lactone lactonase YvrE